MISSGAAPQNAYNSGSAPTYLPIRYEYIGYFSLSSGTPPDRGQMSMPEYEVGSYQDNLVDYPLDLVYSAISADLMYIAARSLCSTR
jgi:hypothetical protein